MEDQQEMQPTNTKKDQISSEKVAPSCTKCAEDCSKVPILDEYNPAALVESQTAPSASITCLTRWLWRGLSAGKFASRCETPAAHSPSSWWSTRRIRECSASSRRANSTNSVRRRYNPSSQCAGRSATRVGAHHRTHQGCSFAERARWDSRRHHIHASSYRRSSRARWNAWARLLMVSVIDLID